eukprot:3187715-Prymnesium_polylepis.2
MRPPRQRRHRKPRGAICRAMRRPHRPVRDGVAAGRRPDARPDGGAGICAHAGPRDQHRSRRRVDQLRAGWRARRLLRPQFGDVLRDDQAAQP